MTQRRSAGRVDRRSERTPGRTRRRIASQPAHHRDRAGRGPPTARRGPCRRSRTARRCGRRPQTAQIPAQSSRHSGASGSSRSTSSRVIGARSSWSPSIGKASGSVTWSWYSSSTWATATPSIGRRQRRHSVGPPDRSRAADDDAVDRRLEVDRDRDVAGDAVVAEVEVVGRDRRARRAGGCPAGAGARWR